jgi:hypothetical protein
MSNERPPRRLVDIAAELGRNPAGFLKFVRRRNIEPFKAKEGQNTPWYLHETDYEKLKEIIDHEEFVAPAVQNTPTRLSGVYAIEIPSYDGPLRLKIGWSDNIADRLNTYRTIVPDLRVLRVWPCSASKRWYEKLALEWAGQHGKQIGQEIFEFEDNAAAAEALCSLFEPLGIKEQKLSPDAEHP